LRDDREFCSASLQIEDGVGHISLGEKSVRRVQFNDLAAKTCIRKKSGAVEGASSALNIQNRPF
jgi:hypothetical protein